MLNQPYIILIILVITMALFISDRWRYDIVALLSLAMAVGVGAVPYQHVFSGLANPAVITVACIMIISQTIHRTNVLSTLVTQLTHVNQSPTRQVATLCGITAFFSAFMNNVGALGLMMPVAIETARNSKRSPALVLLPIALAAGLGGLLTMTGTPSNLLIANFREQAIGQPFAMFDFSRVGMLVATAGVAFIVLIGWRLIPGSRKASRSIEERFQIKDYITEIKLSAASPFINETVKSMEEALNVDYILIAILRNKHKRFTIPSDQVLVENDILIIESSPENLEKILTKGKFEMIGHDSNNTELLRSDEITVTEATVPPGSKAVNRSAKHMRLKTRYGMNLLGIARQGKPFGERLHEVNLKVGDIILLHGSPDNISQHITDYGLLPLEQRNIALGAGGKKWLAVIIFIIALILAATQLLPVQIAFAAAVLMLVLTRSTAARNLYEDIEWPVIILLAAMIPLGEALRNTGGTALIANLIVSNAHHFSGFLIVSLLFLVTMTLSDFMNNAATTVVMAPIAISISQALHSNIDTFLMTVAVAASCSFLTPIGHQNNMIVMGPGGYKFIDYIKIGLPLELVVFAVAIPSLLCLWPLNF